MANRPRGARPTPRHRLAAAVPHKIRGVPLPANFLWNPAQLSMWLNDQYGDCVSAEEAFAKATANPEIFIQDQTVYNFARAGGFLDGALLPDVMDAMIASGFKQDGNTYSIGKYASVDWTNAAVLQDAIFQGPVKIGIAADQIENAVNSTNGRSGWFATGFRRDDNEDHCVSLCGYGSASWLGQQLGAQGLPDVPAYGLYTWKSIGVIDVGSMVAITAEAWLRSPTNLVNGQPVPSPVPPSPPPLPPSPPTPPVNPPGWLQARVDALFTGLAAAHPIIGPEILYVKNLIDKAIFHNPQLAFKASALGGHVKDVIDQLFALAEVEAPVYLKPFLPIVQALADAWMTKHGW